jgi:hypothetical protein
MERGCECDDVIGGAWRRWGFTPPLPLCLVWEKMLRVIDGVSDDTNNLEYVKRSTTKKNERGRSRLLVLELMRGLEDLDLP